MPMLKSAPFPLHPWPVSRQVLACCALAALLASEVTSAQGLGLRAQADALLNAARWQTRLEQELPTAIGPGYASWGLSGHTNGLARLPALQAGTSTTLPALRLLGDLQFDTLRLGDDGGLRLTGGLLLNRSGSGRSPTGDTPPTLPYAGVGYSSSGGTGSPETGLLGWGFSADLGWAATRTPLQGNGLTRAIGLGSEGGLRELRLQPHLRLGMSLSF